MKAKIFILQLLLQLTVQSHARQAAGPTKNDSPIIVLNIAATLIQNCSHNDIVQYGKRTCDTLFIIDRCTVTTVDLCALSAGCFVEFAILTASQIAAKPTTDITDLMTFVPGMYQRSRNAPLINDGGRPTANLYVVDGIRLLEAPDAQWASRHLRNQF